MSFLEWVIFLGIFGFAAARAWKLKKQRDAEESVFAGEYRGWDVYKSAYDRGVIALDHQGKRIAVGKTGRLIDRPWSDISSVELEKNGQSITQTNRGSQLVGAAAGAVLLGPLGLLVGSIGGPKRTKQRVNQLSLKVTIDDRTAPVHHITFFRMKGDGIDAQSRVLQEPAAKMDHFHALIANAIRQDNRSFAKQIVNPSADSGDTHERLAKLWDLKQAGALTQDEFDVEKRTLLSGAPAGGMIDNPPVN